MPIPRFNAIERRELFLSLLEAYAMGRGSDLEFHAVLDEFVRWDKASCFNRSGQELVLTLDRYVVDPDYSEPGSWWQRFRRDICMPSEEINNPRISPSRHREIAARTLEALRDPATWK